ncbi:DUF2062 domain-containing protein [Mesobacillus harenae]|uniref:DUF2062 domain-containing protein n=1 Tax=Mesobacillus harenae TaxID=2213203 RepID=UPI0015810862|nr:DUF2062 domain-containing protein [Mesobacillus harenae]
MKLKRQSKYFLIRLFRQKSSPHEVAMGLSVGFVPNWFPTFGLGPVFSIGIAKLTKVNVISAFMGGVIGTPLWPVFFLLNYKTGSLFLNQPREEIELKEVEYLEVFNNTIGNLQSGSLQFLTGALINIVISSWAVYLISYVIFKRYRMDILAKLK